MTDLEVEHREKQHEFVADTPSGPAYVSYSRPDDATIEIRHTVVPDDEEGRGLASALVRAAIEYARRQRLRVVPTCSFARGWFERHPGERDVLKGD